MTNIRIQDEIMSYIKGDLYFEVVDKNTNEVVDDFHDHNVVVYDSGKILIKLIYEGLNDYFVRVAKIGDDVGDGDENDPQPQSRENTLDDLNEIYSTSNMTIDYLDEWSITYNIFISGEDVMQQYPEEDSVGFTSIGLVSNNDILFSFRRFPVRTITENFNVNIIWKIYYEPKN